MRRFCLIFVFAISTLILGCTRPAPVPHRISFEDIIHKVHCELHDAVRSPDYAPKRARLHRLRNTHWDLWWENWKAGIQLKIQTDKDADLSSAADFTAPINRGRFSLGLAGGLKKQSTNSTTFNFDVFMDELSSQVDQTKDGKSTYKFDSELCKSLENNEGGRGRLLAGSLGLTEWLQRAATAYNKTGISSTGQVYFVKFIITLNASAKPGFNITSPSGETYSVSITAGGKRVRTHELTVTLAKLPDDSGTKEDSDEVKALKEIIGALNDQLALLESISKNTENSLAFAPISEADRKRIEQSQAAQRDKISELKQKIQSAEKRLNRIKGTTSGSSVDSRIRELQLLDAISRIESN